MLSAKSLNLDQSKILSSGNGLRLDGSLKTNTGVLIQLT